MKKAKATAWSLSMAALVTLASCASLPADKADSEDKSSKSPAQETVKKNIAPVSNPLPNGYIEIIEDFEDSNYWQAAGATDRNNYSMRAETSEEWVYDGMYSGQWTLSSVPEGKNAGFWCEALRNDSWEEAVSLMATINNTTQGPLAVYAEVECGSHHEKARTSSVDIGIGENINVIFDLVHRMTDETGNEIPGIPEPESIKKLTFRFEGKNSGGTVFIDNISLVK